MNSPYRWVVLGIATGAQTAASFVTQGIGPLAAVWRAAYHLSPLQVGLLVSAANVGPIFSLFVLGCAIDRYGERWLVSLGCILLGVTMAGLSLVTSYPAFLLFLTTAGAWYATAQPGGSKALIKWFRPKQRAIAMGIRQTGIPLGGALAAVSLPVLAARFGWSAAVCTQAVVACVGGVTFGVLYRDSNARRPRDAVRNASPRVDVNLALILRNRRLHPVVIAGVIMVSLQFILLAQFMVFATTQLRMSLSMAGALFGLVQTSGIAGRLLLAWFSDAKLDGDRVGPLRLAALASACSLTAVALLGDRLPVGIFVVLCGSLGFFGIGWYSLFIVHVAECAPSDAVARTLSCALTLNQVAIVVSPVAFGALVGASGSYRVAWLVLAALVGGAVVPLRPRHRRTARALRRQSRNE